MIFLDTNFLIGALVRGSGEDLAIRRWAAAGETVRINVIVRAEFLCGPVVSEHVRVVSDLFPSPEPLVAQDADRAAQLFNQTGRHRGSLADCLIAAVCLRLDAPLATSDLDVFRKFASLGLELRSASPVSAG